MLRGSSLVTLGLSLSFFSNVVVLLALSVHDLDLSLDRFAVKCKAAGIKISISKSEAMVLNQKKVEYLLQVGEKNLSQVEKFKYLVVLFTSEEKSGARGQQADQCSVCSIAESAPTVVVKRVLSRKPQSP